MRRQEGFTLLELIVYVGILAVSAALLTGILSITLKVQNRESAANEVTSQLNFVMQNINRLVRESSNIEIATSAATSTLKLRMKDSAKDPICLSLVNGVIKLAEGPDPSNKQNCVSQTSDLTNDRVVVDALNFTKFSQYPGHDTVSVDIQMTYNSQNPQQRLTREIRSAIARVSAATFDSDVLPGGSYSFSLGQSGSPWKDIFISNLLNLGQLSSDPTTGVQNGSIYYNTSNSVFRGYKSGSWSNLGESLWTASGNNIYNSNSGNVGVNTDNPASRLSVKGNVGIGTGYASVAAPTNGMIVQGDVGIGTTNPAGELDVIGSICFSGDCRSAWNVGKYGYKNIRVKNNAANPNKDIDIEADYIEVEGYSKNSLNLTINGSINGANGLDTGSYSANTWYYVYIIYNPTSSSFAGLISASYTSPTTPSGYTKKRLISTFKTDASANLYLQRQNDSFIAYGPGDYSSPPITDNWVYCNSVGWCSADVSRAIPTASGIGWQGWFMARSNSYYQQMWLFGSSSGDINAYFTRDAAATFAYPYWTFYTPIYDGKLYLINSAYRDQQPGVSIYPLGYFINVLGAGGGS